MGFDEVPPSLSAPFFDDGEAAVKRGNLAVEYRDGGRRQRGLKSAMDISAAQG